MSLLGNEFAGLDRWQVSEIEKGIEEANRDEFASDQEVIEFIKRRTDGKR